MPRTLLRIVALSQSCCSNDVSRFYRPRLADPQGWMAFEFLSLETRDR